MEQIKIQFCENTTYIIAMINLRAVSTKLYFNLIFAMQTYKEIITMEQILTYTTGTNPDLIRTLRYCENFDVMNYLKQIQRCQINLTACAWCNFQKYTFYTAKTIKGVYLWNLESKLQNPKYEPKIHHQVYRITPRTTRTTRRLRKYVHMGNK